MRNQDVALKVAARLRELREERQLSVRALGQRVGLGTEVVSRAERGLQTPTIQTLERLCQGLDVSLSTFFSDERKALPSVASGRVRRLEGLLSGLDPNAQELLVTSFEGVARALTVSFRNRPVPLKAAAERKASYPTRRRR